MGPGRWGTSTPDLGVHVTYSDIYNTHALVELAGEAVGASREPSFGTHFFQDLMEADIYPLGIFLDDKNTIFKRDFFYDTPSHLTEFVSVDNPRVIDALRLIVVSDYRANHHLDLVMDAHKSYAVAFLVEEEVEVEAVEEKETSEWVTCNGIKINRTAQSNPDFFIFLLEHLFYFICYPDLCLLRPYQADSIAAAFILVVEC